MGTRREGMKGPVHTLDYGDYYAVIRGGVPMIERADTAGAVREIHFTSEAARERWVYAIRQDERVRARARQRAPRPASGEPA